MSSSRLIMTGSPAGGRTTASAVPAFIAWSCWRMPLSSLGACSAWSTIQEKPAPAITSATILLQRLLHSPIWRWCARSAALKSVPIRLRDDVGVHACLPC